MSESTSKTPFIKSSSQDQYGKKALQSWSGKVVSYEAQKDQIDNGWGWRYKVRILGDHSNVDNVGDDELSYAYALLPTTAGSGGAYKLRSARISQGDMVYGVRGGGGPTLILGVFPRTRQTTISDAPFGTKSGFYGTLVKNGTISGEFNEQIGPATPGGISEANKSNRPDPSDNVQKIGIDPKEEGVVSDSLIFFSPAALASSHASCVSLLALAFLACATALGLTFFRFGTIKSYCESSCATYEQYVFLLACICSNRSLLFRYFTLFIFFLFKLC